MRDDPDTKRGRTYLAGVEELGVTCLGCFWHRAFFRWEDDGRPVEMFSDLASQALEAKCVRIAQLAAAVWCAVNAALLFFRAWLDLDAARGFDELYADLIAAGASSVVEAWAPRIAMYAAFGLLWLGLTVWGVRGGAHAPEMARAQRRTARSRIDPPGKETTMNDVKKTWCGPVYTLDPEKMERQFNRLSAEGWQLVERRMSTATVCSTSTSPATVRGTTMCAAPASCVSLCDFYRISMRECRGANGKNGLPFRGKRL